MSPLLQITEFEGRYRDCVADLVVGIQRDEFGFDVSKSQQADLLDISGYYFAGAGNFWLALDEGSVIGTIGLLDLGDGIGSLRKMFVRPEYRGTGAARQLLDRLLAHAQAARFRQIVLGTTSRYHAAQRFYEKSGFRIVTPESLPDNFPRFDIEDLFYRLVLDAA